MQMVVYKMNGWGGSMVVVGWKDVVCGFALGVDEWCRLDKLSCIGTWRDVKTGVELMLNMMIGMDAWVELGVLGRV